MGQEEVVGHNNNNGVVTTGGGAGWRFRRVGAGGESDDDEHKTTEMQTFIHLLKGYVGPGCLSLPWAISQLGIPLGCLSCFVMAWWSSYNCWCVVRLKRLQQAEMNQRRRHAVAAVSRGTSTTTTSSDVVVDDEDGEEDHQNRHITYPEVAAWYCGRRMYQFTTLCICVQQLAICTVFLSFVGTNLQAVLNLLLVLGNVNHVTVISLALPAVMALSFLPDLKALAPVTAAGTALLLLGLLFLGIVIAVEWPDRPSSAGTNDDGTSAASSIMLPNLEQIPISLCAVLYSYEGICLILPVESAMKQPRKFGPVFVYAMIAAGSIFAITGALAVAAFGRVTDGSITAFLLAKYGNGHSLRTWVLAANAAVSFSVLVTYPLQLFPALELLGPLCFSSPNDRHHQRRGGDSITVRDLSIEGNGISTTTGLVAGAAAAGRSPTSGGDFIAIPESDPEGTERTVVPNAHAHASNHLHHSDNEEPGDMTALSAPVVQVPASATAGLWVADDGTMDDDEVVVVSPGSRVALVMVTYLVAVAVPNVQALISLAGALAGSSTALIIPPILQTAWYRRHRQTRQQQADDDWSSSSSRRLRAVDPTSACLLVGGLIFLFIGTVASILDIIQVYRHHGGEQEEGGS